MKINLAVYNIIIKYWKKKMIYSFPIGDVYVDNLWIKYYKRAPHEYVKLSCYIQLHIYLPLLIL